MQKQLVIAIGRQFGSGGREIGQKLAEKLGIAFYDKEILAHAAKQSGIIRQLFEDADEKPTSSFLYNLSTGVGYSNPVFYAASDSLPTGDRLFAWQAKTIRQLAEQGPCVFIGRCADYILRDEPGLVSVFIHAPMAERAKRISRLHHLREDAAALLCRKTDRSRASYYSFCTDREWGACSNYDLCLDSSKLGVDGTVDALAHFVSLL